MVASKNQRLAGWVFSGLIAAMLIVASASGKFTEWPGKEEMFAKLGYSADTMFKIGIVEVVATILFLIPRTSFLGAILLTAYLGGATATHVRVGDPWIAYALRRPDVIKSAFGAD
ncbi:MAG: hypothetical protein FD138_2568 [Planctomycetota bacterium]|nr:MAG: hypothetical protein FD138_2568 [Planctomycetota bacterium]